MPFLLPVLLIGGTIGGTALAVGYGAKQAETTVKWATVATVAILAGVVYTSLVRK